MILALKAAHELAECRPIPLPDFVHRLVKTRTVLDRPGQESPQGHLEYLELMHDLAIRAVHDELVHTLVGCFRLGHADDRRRVWTFESCYGSKAVQCWLS